MAISVIIFLVPSIFVRTLWFLQITSKTIIKYWFSSLPLDVKEKGHMWPCDQPGALMLDLIFWDMKHMTKGSCWLQTFVPMGFELSSPVIGLYTCIRIMKNSVGNQRWKLSFWLVTWDWSDRLSVTMKIMFPRRYLPLALD